MKLNKPQIRFKNFGDSWEEKKLGTFCVIGDIDHRMPKTVSVGIPYLMTGDFIGINGLNFENSKLVSEEDYEVLSKKIKPETGDILFARYASVGAVRFVETLRKFLISYSCAIIKKNDLVNGKYLFFQFQSNEIQNQIELVINTGSQRNIGIDSLKKLVFHLPKKNEQQLVANFFQNLDQLISLHQEKYDKLVILKKAMLEKMFPQPGANVPEIRFKGFEGDWEEKDFGNEVEFFNGLTYSPLDVIKESGTLVLRSSNVKNSEIVEADNVYVNSEAVNVDNVKIGDIIVVVRNGSRSLIGKHAQIKKEMENTVIGAFMTGIRSSHSNFINTLLNTSQFNSEIEKNLGATINQITNGSFKKMRFMFPDDKEQDVIGNYFQNLDNLISLNQRQLEKLKNIKKACLEKMFV